MQYVYSSAGTMALIESHKPISEASVIDVHITCEQQREQTSDVRKTKIMEFIVRPLITDFIISFEILELQL